MADVSPSITPTSSGLRALSHPTRLKMLMRLRVDGPATATTLARELSLNTGATSYHLRRLAEHGFIVEDTGRGDARDRWWKAAHQSTRANLTDRRDDEDAESAEAYLQTVALMYTETLMQAVSERRYLPEPWQRASTASDWHLRLTPARAEQLVDRLAELVDEWQEADEGAQDVGDFVVNLNAFPRPGTVVTEGTAR
jgi:predicted ArsR family transcriptional regulator